MKRRAGWDDVDGEVPEDIPGEETPVDEEGEPGEEAPEETPEEPEPSEPAEPADPEVEP